MSSPSLIEYSNPAPLSADQISPACQELIRRLTNDQGGPGAGILKGPHVYPEPGFPPTGTEMAVGQEEHEVSCADLGKGHDVEGEQFLQVESLGDAPTYERPGKPPDIRVESVTEAIEAFNSAFNAAARSGNVQTRLETVDMSSSLLPPGNEGGPGSTGSSIGVVRGILALGKAFHPPDSDAKTGYINWLLEGGPSILVVIDPQSTSEFDREWGKLNKLRTKATPRRQMGEGRRPFIIPSLSYLRRQNIRYHLIIQKKFDICVVLPGVFTYGFHMTAKHSEFKLFSRLEHATHEGTRAELPILGQTLSFGEELLSPVVIEEGLPQEINLGEAGLVSAFSRGSVSSPAADDDLSRPGTSNSNRRAFPDNGDEATEADRIIMSKVQQALQSGNKTKKDFAKMIEIAWPHVR